MYYPRFTKAIIHHFFSKDKSISMRNRMFMHTAQDDCILDLLFICYWSSNSKSKRIYKKTASPTIKTITKSPKETPSKKKTASAKKDVSSKNPLRKQSTGVKIRDTPNVFVLKNKAPVTTHKSKDIPDEPKGKSTNTSKGTGVKLGVLDVDDDGNDDDNDNDDDDSDSDDVRTESDSIQKAFQSYTAEFEKKAQDENHKYQILTS
ncbi:hypothetical protein Tco_0696185 [Tanacetum coccineum]